MVGLDRPKVGELGNGGGSVAHGGRINVIEARAGIPERLPLGMGPMVGQKARVGDERAFDGGPFVGVLGLEVGADQHSREEKHQEEIQQDLLRPREFGKRGQFGLTCTGWRRRDGDPAAFKRSLWHGGNRWHGGGCRWGSGAWAAAGAGRGWRFTKRTHFGMEVVWSEGFRDGGSNPGVAGIGAELLRCRSLATAPQHPRWAYGGSSDSGAAARWLWYMEAPG